MALFDSLNQNKNNVSDRSRSNSDISSSIWNDQRRASMSTVLRCGASPVIISILICYFAWMDLNLYSHFVLWKTAPPRNVTAASQLYDAFAVISVKKVMIDHMNSYVYTPLAEDLQILVNLSENVPWLSPNMISIIHLVLGIIGGLLLKDSNWRRSGLVLVFFSLFLDALDGAVARARLRTKAYLTDFYSVGYYVEGVSDTAVTMAVCYSLLVVLRRHPQYHATPLASREKDVESRQPLLPEGRSYRWMFWCLMPITVFGAFAFNYVLEFYSNLLEPWYEEKLLQEYQREVTQSVWTWLVMWTWKLVSGTSFLNYFVFAFLFDAIPEFTSFLYQGSRIVMPCLVILCQFHMFAVSKFRPAL